MGSLTTVKSSRLIRALPFYYGWVILAAGTLGIIMMGPSQTFTIGVFLDYLIADLGVSRANISLLYGLATLGASLLLPVTGRLTDRYGARRMVVVVVIGLGLASFWMSWAPGVAAIFAGLLALRFFGFGSLQLVSNNVIAQWFIRRRGFVMGLSGLSLPIGLLIFPVLSQALINRFEWRGAWVALGLLVWVVMLPVGGLLFKDRPEQYGLTPDGDAPPPAARPGTAAPPAETNWTLAEARHTGAFWIFAVALSTMTMILAGLVFHQISLFEVRGLSRETAVAAYNITALFSAISNIGMGRLLDRHSARLLLSLVMLLLAATMTLVLVMHSPWQAFLYAALQGLVSGCFRVMDATVWPKYYGRLHLGSIKGATMLGVIGATSLGPYPLGLSMDYFGSYAPVLGGLLVLPLAISVLALFVNRPEKQAGAALAL
ncbi:MAG: MFS transporter [Anaerolineae bacterium]